MQALLAVVAVVLTVSALAKLVTPRASAAALGWLVPRAASRAPALFALVAVELALAAGLVLAAAGRVAEMPIAIATAVFLGGAALLLGRAVLEGRTGERCGCFGSRGRIGWPAVVRNAVLAGLVLAPLVPADTEAWLITGVAVALAGVLALTVVCLSLAREVGELRMHLTGDVALEIPAEGPALGSPAEGWPREAFDALRHEDLHVAVFTSEGCAMCRRLAPAVAHLERDPRLALARFEESADAPVWSALAIPGAPFAVVADAEGVPLAKGTFNSLGQLESIVATAARRRAGHGVRAAA